MQTITERAHLDWATNRALEYFDYGDKNNAFASFLSDVTKHPGTTWIAGHPATMMLLEVGWAGGREEFRKACAGFSASEVLNVDTTPVVPVNTANADGAAQVHFGGLAGGDFSSAVLLQEAAGQSSFVNSDTLPSEISVKDRKILERAGVVFGDKVPGDDLFLYVTLPQGWRKQATSHSMHSNLVDDQGRLRASIFYKAAFYDRRADIDVVARFSIYQTYGLADGEIVFTVSDSQQEENPVFTTATYRSKATYGPKYRRMAKRAENEAKSWLDKCHPQWETASIWD